MLFFRKHLLCAARVFSEHLQLLMTLAGLESVSEHPVWQSQSGGRCVSWILQSFC